MSTGTQSKPALDSAQREWLKNIGAALDVKVAGADQPSTRSWRGGLGPGSCGTTAESRPECASKPIGSG